MPSSPPPSAIPITILTGFLGAGKTTLLLNLLPQLPPPPITRLCILKNEFGSVAVDSKLLSAPSSRTDTPSSSRTPDPTSTPTNGPSATPSSSPIAGVQELLNGCICCNLVGQLSPALLELSKTYSPTRIVIETSGSAFPATLALEINRLSNPPPDAPADTPRYFLDGVVMVVDVENWKGYEDKGYTAKLQAKFTDLVVLNKWEECSERRVEEVVDWIREVGEDTAVVKSRRGWVGREVVFGVEGGVGMGVGGSKVAKMVAGLHGKGHGDEGCGHEHDDTHSSEVDVISVTLPSRSSNSSLSLEPFMKLLTMAPRDEVYRLKAVFKSAIPPSPPPNSPPTPAPTTTSSPSPPQPQMYILNWAFGRWTFTPISQENGGEDEDVLNLTAVLSHGEGARWKKKFETAGWFVPAEEEAGDLKVEVVG